MVLSEIWVKIGIQYSALNVSLPLIVRISVQPMFTREAIFPSMHFKPQLQKKQTDKLLFCGIFCRFSRNLKGSFGTMFIFPNMSCTYAWDK